MKICIDAGHYGKYNQSPADLRYYESDFTWKLHLLQKKYLEAYGIEVVTTRPTQEGDLSLYRRGELSRGCELFISDHTNAVGAGVNDSVDYPAAYCAIDGRADGIGMALAQCVEQVIGTRQPARIEHRRGKNGDYYGVLRGATAVGTPGLILEHSFHTNTQIARWLLNEENIDRLAKAEAHAIALYYNVADPLPEKRSGWVQEGGGWRFYLGNTGEPVRNDWYLDGEAWYWFDGAGMMVQDTWKTGGDGKWYYLGPSGAMAKDQWVVWKKALYRLNENGTMFEGKIYLETDDQGALIVKKKEIEEEKMTKETGEKKVKLSEIQGKDREKPDSSRRVNGAERKKLREGKKRTERPRLKRKKTVLREKEGHRRHCKNEVM